MNVCPTCNYVGKDGVCDNPGCASNPSLSEERLRKMLAWRQRIDREEDERAELRRIRERMNTI